MFLGVLGGQQPSSAPPRPPGPQSAPACTERGGDSVDEFLWSTVTILSEIVLFVIRNARINVISYCVCWKFDSMKLSLYVYDCAYLCVYSLCSYMLILGFDFDLCLSGILYCQILCFLVLL